MFNTFQIQKKSIVLSILMVFVLALVACGNSADEIVMSDAPPSRGSVDVAGDVIDITADILDADFDAITETADFRADLGATDADMEEIAEEIEQLLSVTLTNDEVAGLTTVGSAIDLIKSKK